jgi:large subunit ribosomal protein L35
MPKQKTHKGARKRFRVSANGKLKRKQAGKRHLNSSKSGQRKQHLRATISETDKVSKKIRRAMGYG